MGTLVTKTCLTCGRPFSYISSTRPRKYCAECRPVYRPVDHPEQPCVGCGAVFKPVRIGQKYCSDACRWQTKNRARYATK